MRELGDQPFFGLLQKIFDTGEVYSGEGTIFLSEPGRGVVTENWIEFSYSPVRGAAGDVTEIVAEGRLWTPRRDKRLDAKMRAERFGVASLTDQELLALFLDDEDEDRSEELYLTFGSLSAVLGASRERLQLIRPSSAIGPRGLCAGSVLRLDVAREMNVRTLRQAICERPLLERSASVDAYLRSVLADRPREQFRVLFLDRALYLLADECLGEGSVGHAPVYPREVCRRALELSAAGMILVHNHPGRSERFSPNDLSITRKVLNAAQALDLMVHDHVLIAGEKIIWMKQGGAWPW